MLSSRKKHKDITVACPACGAEQMEPAMAISSNCRKCGAHFRIEKGEAVIPPGARVSGISLIVTEKVDDAAGSESEPAVPRQPSLGAEARSFEKEPRGTRGVGETWMNRSAEDESPDPGKNPDANSRSKKRKRGRRKRQRQAVAKHPDRPTNGAAKAPDEQAPKSTETGKDSLSKTAGGEGRLGEEAQPIEALREGSMSAMLGGAMEKLTGELETEKKDEFHPKMPSTFRPAQGQKKSHVAMRNVRCFECNHQQPVSVAASSTQCARCSVYISLVDHDIASSWSQNIRTRGNVHIRKRGSVTGCDVACHNLEVDGRLSATVDCSGEATFRSSSRIMGHMHCRQLVVEKKCEVIFPQGVWAESVEIHGTVVGNINCAGTIRIYKHGKVEGDATARAVDLKDGGELSGRMSIQSDLDITPPEKQGFRR
ncbi:MAG: polymer-forming cytoskeletal protein [Verrucomicrobiae bacterium]|nr:polymer-forming cytoskeletal protein [Verrucomicrobiae bacterium]